MICAAGADQPRQQVGGRGYQAPPGTLHHSKPPRLICGDSASGRLTIAQFGLARRTWKSWNSPACGTALPALTQAWMHNSLGFSTRNQIQNRGQEFLGRRCHRFSCVTTACSPQHANILFMCCYACYHGNADMVCCRLVHVTVQTSPHAADR